MSDSSTFYKRAIFRKAVVISLARSLSQVDIVVGTPGRLDDLISTGKLDLSQVRFLVLDECVRRSAYKISNPVP